MKGSEVDDERLSGVGKSDLVLASDVGGLDQPEKRKKGFIR